MSKKIQGIKVSRNGPLISHLFFVDDFLIFCKAFLEELYNFKTLLTKYEEAHSQCVNFEKSLFFSANYPPHAINPIRHSLGISRIGGMGKYLDLSTLMRMRKMEVFYFILDKVVKKVCS